MCDQCNGDNPDNANYCIHCGALLAEAYTEETQRLAYTIETQRLSEDNIEDPHTLYLTRDQYEYLRKRDQIYHQQHGFFVLGNRLYYKGRRVTIIEN